VAMKGGVLWRIKLLGVFGVVLAVGLVFASGAAAKPGEQFVIEEPSGPVAVAIDDGVQLQAMEPVVFDAGSWSIQCEQGTLAGTVEELAAKEMTLSLSTVGFSGLPPNPCESTWGATKVTFPPVPILGVVKKDGKAELTGTEKGDLAFTLDFTEKGISCTYRASKVKSMYPPNPIEPIVLKSGEAKLKLMTEDSGGECPKKGALMGDAWALTARATSSELFYPVALEQL
jgi:hypothetical protein